MNPFDEIRLEPLDEDHGAELKRLFQIDTPTLQGYLAEEVFGWSMSRVIFRGDTVIGFIRASNLALDAGCGVLGTWLVPEVWGTGVNQFVKNAFLQEIYEKLPEIQDLYLCIEESNVRSLKAASKLKYAVPAGTEEIPECLLTGEQEQSISRKVWYRISRDHFKRYQNG